MDENSSDIFKEKLVSHYENLGWLYAYTSNSINAEKEFLKALKIRESFSKVNNIDTAIDYYSLSQIYYTNHKYDELNKVYKKIMKLLEGIKGQKSLYIIYEYSGGLASQNKNFKKSNKYLTEAILRAKKTYYKNKNNNFLSYKIYNYYLFKMKNYQNLNNINEIYFEYKNAIDFLQSIEKISSSKLSKFGYKISKKFIKNYNNQGDSYKKEQKINKALEAYIRALNISRKFIVFDINNTTWQNEIFIQQIKIADSYKNQKDYNQSLLYYNDGIKVMKKLYDPNKSYQAWQLNLSLVYNRLGDVYKIENNVDKALENYLKAFKVLKLGLDLNPSDKELKSRLKTSTKDIKYIVNLYINKVNSLIKKSKTDDGIVLYKKVIKQLTDESFQHYIAYFNINIGNIYKYQKKFKKALRYYNKALIIQKELYKNNSKNKNFEQKLHQNYEKIAILYQFQLKDLEKARIFYMKTLNVYSCSFSFLHLYELQIIRNEETKKVYVKTFETKFKNKKEVLIAYRMLKIIKDIAQNKEVDLEEWRSKYEKISLGGWSFKELKEWSKTLEDAKIKNKILKAIEVFEKHDDKLRPKKTN